VQVTCECGVQCEKADLAEHADKDCPLRFVGCSYCGARVRLSVRDAHETECGCKTDNCDMCGALVLRRGMLRLFARRATLCGLTLPQT